MLRQMAEVGSREHRGLGSSGAPLSPGPPCVLSWCPCDLQFLKSGVLEVTKSLGMAGLQGALSTGCS